ncbi:MAG TPA: ABC transporter permease [Lacipirellulaceae bacterium]|nr:ABC transporter permease [Lacipirellulaceae bacterium]
MTTTLPGGDVAPHAAGSRTSLIGSCWTLYLLTLRQYSHGKRWIALAVLFMLPAGLAILIRWHSNGTSPSLFLDFVLSWILTPQALLPLIALLYASGVIQDEQEDQTITYLLVRPLPKSLLYIVKMMATWTTTVALVILLTVLTFCAIYVRGDIAMADVVSRCVKTASIHSLAVVTYSSIFGLLALITKRSLVVGIVYTVAVEGVLANLPFSVRMATVVYYSRIMAYRSLDFVVSWPRGRKNDVAAEAWFLDVVKDPTLTEHPQLSTCIWFLIIVSLVCTAIAASLCTQREFHVKTPEKD